MLLGLYVLLGVGTIVAFRVESNRFDGFYKQVHPGITKREVLQRVDDLYRQNPRRWVLIMVTGTKEGTKSGEPLRLTWISGNVPTSETIDDTATKLTGSHHLRVTFRTHVGYLYFTVDLDDAGTVTAVSPVDGHQI